MRNTLRTWAGSALLSVVWVTVAASAAPTQAAPSGEPRDRQHDFDGEVGTWKTELRRLVKPLSGSTEWAEYTGTSVVRPVLDGRANLVELRVKGTAGGIEGVSLRLYNPESRQWSLNYASVGGGIMTAPVFGGFREGRGEFYGQDTVNGRAVFVRFVVVKVTNDSWRFEQAYSADGGRTWELNWVAVDTRMSR